jgi:hypothetical protein
VIYAGCGRCAALQPWSADLSPSGTILPWTDASPSFVHQAFKTRGASIQSTTGAYQNSVPATYFGWGLFVKKMSFQFKCWMRIWDCYLIHFRVHLRTAAPLERHSNTWIRFSFQDFSFATQKIPPRLHYPFSKKNTHHTMLPN